MNYKVFDIETNGLLPNSDKVISGKANPVTKIHCLSYSEYEWENGENKHIKSRTLTDYESIRNFFKCSDVLVGHDIVRYDIPVVELILDIKVNFFMK